ncbi:glycoside hydrolase family 3 protein [Leifsonia poae]|uniref:Sugar hydrolase n=1 Tax=Leifsonia poae TaxID=110933 RepID=A0A9W6H9J2_9MICO|nr:glycoside hydrolase family 3 N-terminal domain-containing protein [Leifsonia poae]GLJ76061.1 sugar hydrolase [Leifsonia poae]
MNHSTDPAVRALVAGVLWPGFLGTTAPDWLLRELDAGLAGAVYFGHNIDHDDEEQLPALSRRLSEARAGVLLGVDEEGGTVTRLEAAHGSTLPGAAQLGRVDDVDATRAVGAELARRVRASGATVVLAPVADVNTNPRNPVIGVRSFGSSAALVSRHVVASVEGIQSGGVAACVKHFPGHGDTSVDSHHGLPRVELAPAEIESDHLPPFQAAIDAGVAAVMTSHVVLPSFGELPATLNPRILASLRERGFTGAIVTDALDMAAIRSEYGAGRGAVLALQAGADLLCIGNPSPLGPKRGTTDDLADYLEVRDALLGALDDGALAVADLERASGAVSALSEWVESRRAASVVADGSGAGFDRAAGFDAARIVREAISVSGTVDLSERPLAVLDLRDRATIAVASTADPFTAALSAGNDCVRVGVGPLGGRDVVAVLADALAHVEQERTIVALVDAVQPGSPQRRAVGMLAAARPGSVVVNAGLPGSEPLPLATVDAFGVSRLTAEVVAGLLNGAMVA